MVSIPTILQKWTKRNDFLKAQIQVIVILATARFGDKWVRSYPRNDNHNPHMFWLMNGLLALVALLTLKRDDDGSVGASVVVASSLNNADGTSSKVMEAAATTAAGSAAVPSPSSSTPPTPTPPISTTTNNKKVIPLSRAQTEEWKGWMQWAFVFYHYYRVYYVYNEIRVFVSAYVWMTGFGNYLYFTKKRDFSLDRVVSMWLRINYFPLLLSYVVGVELELYYVVPLHTVGFFVTMGTCYVQDVLKERVGMSMSKAGLLAVGLSLVLHVVFYETPLVNTLLHISKEYHFRFRSDKYSAWVGIVSGYGWSRVTDYMQWAYGGGEDEGNATTGLRQRLIVPWAQRFVGLLLILTWYFTYGHIQDKYTYNPIHPYIFFLPVFGYLLLRNSSRYLTLLHSPALEFFGKITLETYVLQFHVFMCKKVQHIPIIVPGSGPDGVWYLKFGNMLLCGVGFVALAYWARKVTVMTQVSVTDLVKEIRSGSAGGGGGGVGAQRRLMHGRNSDVELSKTGEGSLPDEEERESFLPNSKDNNVGVENGGHLGKRGGGGGLETETMMKEEVEMMTTQITTNPDAV